MNRCSHTTVHIIISFYRLARPRHSAFCRIGYFGGDPELSLQFHLINAVSALQIKCCDHHLNTEVTHRDTHSTNNLPHAIVHTMHIRGINQYYIQQTKWRKQVGKRVSVPCIYFYFIKREFTSLPFGFYSCNLQLHAPLYIACWIAFLLLGIGKELFIGGIEIA